MECLIQAWDELDDLVALVRQRWLRHSARVRSPKQPLFELDLDELEACRADIAHGARLP